MCKSHGFLVWAVAFGLAWTLSGCGSPTSQEKQKSTDSKVQEQPTGQGEHAAREHQSDTAPSDASTGLAELPDADRAAAEKQRVCPVSGDLLGSAGKPYKVTVKGREVFVCCAACEEAIMKNPDKYLAKLKTNQAD